MFNKKDDAWENSKLTTAINMVGVAALIAVPLVMRGYDCENKITEIKPQRESEVIEYVEETADEIVMEPVENEIIESTEETDDNDVEMLTGYITVNKLNIRARPSTKSNVVGELTFNKKIEYYEHDEKWACINVDGNDAYVSLDYVSSEKIPHKQYSVPYTKGIKTWMPYTTITCKSSKQYKLQRLCLTGKYGIRTYNGRYCVALGTHFGCEIGQYFDLVLKNGTVIPCVLGDIKSDKHTDANNIITVHSNCVSEFIIDKSALDHNARRDGDMSSICDEWDSRVKYIKVYKKGVFNE